MTLYRAATVAFATMHGKETALSKPFRETLGMTVEVAAAINTDLFGTFTGEVPRVGTMLEAARRKAFAAIEATGSTFGLGSEGAFGPHPVIPFLPLQTELLTFVDRRHGLEIKESLRTHLTNFSSKVVGPEETLTQFLKHARFPCHAMVVSPHVQGVTPQFYKGIANFSSLSWAIAQACRLSLDAKALVATDMRAHKNPMRMAIIRRLARAMARRLATSCPRCKAPGFGEHEIERGLPCSLCGASTELPVAYIEKCPSCEFALRTPLPTVSADPGLCPCCNP